MKKLLIVFFFLSTALAAQDLQKISLQDCYQAAVLNYPLQKQFEVLAEKSDLEMKNLSNTYLPKVELSGQAHYQSDVTKMPLDVPIPGFEIPVVPKDWYKFNLDINQVIWDGGVNANNKDVEDKNLAIENQKVEIELYQLKERVKNIYFSVLLYKESLAVLELIRQDLDAKHKDVKAGVENGILLKSDADQLKAEIIQLEQQITELTMSKDASVKMLVEMTHMEIGTETQFLIPETEPISEFAFQTNHRPEYQLISLQQEKLTNLQDVIQSTTMPRFFAFGQAGLGRPGYDFLNADFDTYYMVGLRFNWKFWDWSYSKRERQQLGLQAKLLDYQKETLNENTRLELTRYFTEIKKYKELIAKDHELLELRKSIKAVSSSRLNEGAITSTDYIKDVNEEGKARLKIATHELQLIKAQLDFNSTKGIL